MVSFSRRTVLYAVTHYQQPALTHTIQNKVMSAARLQVTEGPVALLRELECLTEQKQ
jgi:hypothetical protein